MVIKDDHFVHVNILTQILFDFVWIYLKKLSVVFEFTGGQDFEVGMAIN